MNLERFINLIDVCVKSPTEEQLEIHREFLTNCPLQYITFIFDIIQQFTDNNKLQVYYVIGIRALQQIKLLQCQNYDADIILEFLHILITKLYTYSNLEQAKLLIKFTASYLDTFNKNINDITEIQSFINEYITQDVNHQMIALYLVQLLTEVQRCYKYIITLDQIKQFFQQLLNCPQVQKYFFYILKNIILQLYHSSSKSHMDVYVECVSMYLTILQRHQNDYNIMLTGIKVLNDITDYQLCIFEGYIDTLLDALIHVSLMFMQNVEQNKLFLFNSDYFSILDMIVVLVDPPQKMQYSQTQWEKIIQLLDFMFFNQLQHFACDEYLSQLQEMETDDQFNIYTESYNNIQSLQKSIYNEPLILNHIQMLIQQPEQKQFTVLQWLSILLSKHYCDISQALSYVFSLDMQKFSILDHLETINFFIKCFEYLEKETKNKQNIQEQFIKNCSIYINACIYSKYQYQLIFQGLIDLLYQISLLPLFDITKIDSNVYLLNKNDNVFTQIKKLKYIIKFYKFIDDKFLETYVQSSYQQVMQYDLQSCYSDIASVQFLIVCVQLVTKIITQQQCLINYFSQEQALQFLRRLFDIYNLSKEEDPTLLSSIGQMILNLSISSQQIFDQVAIELYQLMQEIQQAQVTSQSKQDNILQYSTLVINSELIQLQKCLNPTLSNIFLNFKCNNETIINHYLALRDRLQLKQYGFHIYLINQVKLVCHSIYFLFNNGLIDKGVDESQKIITTLNSIIQNINVQANTSTLLTEILQKSVWIFGNFKQYQFISSVLQITLFLSNKLLNHLQTSLKQLEPDDDFSLTQYQQCSNSMNNLIDIFVMCFSYIDGVEDYINNNFNSQDLNNILFNVYFCKNIYSNIMTYQKEFIQKINILQLFILTGLQIKSQFSFINDVLQYFLLHDNVIHDFLLQLLLLEIKQQEQLNSCTEFIAFIYDNVKNNLGTNITQLFIYRYLNIQTIIDIINAKFPEFNTQLLQASSNFDIVVSVIGQRFQYFDKNVTRQVLTHLLNNIGLSSEMEQTAQNILGQLQ